jgi:hypothetical protein
MLSSCDTHLQHNSIQWKHCTLDWQISVLNIAMPTVAPGRADTKHNILNIKRAECLLIVLTQPATRPRTNVYICMHLNISLLFPQQPYSTTNTRRYTKTAIIRQQEKQVTPPHEQACRQCTVNMSVTGSSWKSYTNSNRLRRHRGYSPATSLQSSNKFSTALLRNSTIHQNHFSTALQFCVPHNYTARMTQGVDSSIWEETLTNTRRSRTRNPDGQFVGTSDTGTIKPSWPATIRIRHSNAIESDHNAYCIHTLYTQTINYMYHENSGINAAGHNIRGT